MESIKDAFNLAKNCPNIKEINLGGTKATNGTQNISKSVNITMAEIEIIKELDKLGVNVEIRMVPGEKAIRAVSILKNIN